MSKRIFLLIATNILVVLTLTVILHFTGLSRYLSGMGGGYDGFFLTCLAWGFGGAFLSLGLSRIMAKFAMGVQVIDPENPGEFSGLVEMVHRLAREAGLPALPEVGVYQSPELNAFATGPTKRRALVAVSTGLLQRMESDEIEGVLGHEITHIANGDMVTMTLLQGVINAFVIFFSRILAATISGRDRDGERSSGGNWMLVMLLQTVLSFLGMFVVAWFSRQREFRADAGGAAVAGRGRMMGALQALQRAYERRVEDPRGAALATLKISGHGGLFALLSTHPPLEERIARLQAAQG